MLDARASRPHILSGFCRGDPMSDSAAGPVSGARTPDPAGLRVTVLIGYGLMLLALSNGFTAIAGVILATIKRGEARGTVWYGHFRNIIVAFWVAAVLSAVVLAILLPGAATLAWSLFETNGNPPPELVGGLFAALPVIGLASLLFLVWYLYRMVGGLVRAIDSEPY